MTGRTTLPQLVRAGSESLPADYVERTGRRLGLATLAIAAVHLVYVVLYRTIWLEMDTAVGFGGGMMGLAVSAALAVYLLGAPRPAQHVTRVAVAYEIFLTFILTLSDCWSMSFELPSGQVSWSAVLIVLFPFMIPAGPRVILAAALAAATSVPLAMALAFAILGRAWPEPDVVAAFVLPPFACALLAWAPTSALHRLGAAVQSARRLGNYELAERLGEGGMGEVWRANHRLLARPAAVKLIKPEVLGAKSEKSRQRMIRRFEEEAQATASLDSPHTVELYDFGVSTDGVLFYVMELLDGMDAQTLVERFGALPSERVVYLLLQVCDSLAEAHEHGLIHRDIKPANLFIARKGTAHDFLKVLDFGLVKRWSAEDDAGLLDSLADGHVRQTAAGQIVGTPAFLAPEAALGELALDCRADLYALGCVAYWLLTATTVFDEDTAVAMAIAHVSKTPEPPSQRLARPIDPELERIVMSCLEKDRERRPASAEELRSRLAALEPKQPWSRERAAAWWREHPA